MHIERRATDVALSSSYQRAFGGDGNVTAGARYKHDGVSDHDNVVPRASATLPTFGGVSFSLAGGMYLQPLDVRDLTADVRNGALPPEQSIHTIIGVSRMLRPDVKLSVEGYRPCRRSAMDLFCSCLVRSPAVHEALAFRKTWLDSRRCLLSAIRRWGG